MLTLRSEYMTTHQMSPFLTGRRNIFGHFRQPWEMFGKSSKIAVMFLKSQSFDSEKDGGYTRGFFLS